MAKRKGTEEERAIKAWLMKQVNATLYYAVIKLKQRSDCDKFNCMCMEEMQQQAGNAVVRLFNSTAGELGMVDGVFDAEAAADVIVDGIIARSEGRDE